MKKDTTKIKIKCKNRDKFEFYLLIIDFQTKV